jgi:U3 small nucleolar RNA-associated protein 19
MNDLPNECKVLIQRLRQCDLKEIVANPSIMIKFYPIRNPDSKITVFEEVYCVVNEELLKKTYKFRVFFFLNTFLSSTKIPAHVVAAYIKRLARLSFCSRPRSLVAILRIIHNLFVRHPTLIFLRDRVDERARELVKGPECTLRTWLDMDTFKANETKDLSATNAMDSCVWEVMMLRYHEHPRVAKEAKFLGEQGVPEMEKPLNDILK